MEDPTVMEEPTQFFLDALAEVSYDEDPSKALPGLDEWEVPESIFRDGSCISLWELARVNGYRFKGKNDELAGSTFDEAFCELGVDPVIGPMCQDHLELGPELPTPTVPEDATVPVDVSTQNTCANQPSTVYPLDTVVSLEKADLGPPLAVVQLTPATDASTTQRAPVNINPTASVAPATDVPVTQHAPVAIVPAVQVTPTADPSDASFTNDAPGIVDADVQPTSTTSNSAPGTVKVFTLPQAKSRSQPAKRPPKQKAKRAPKRKQNDELHKTQKKTKAQSTPRKGKNKTTLAPTTQTLLEIAPAPMTPMPAQMTPVTGVANKTVVHPSQQQQLQIQQLLRSQEQYLRNEWQRLRQQGAHLKQRQPGDEQQRQIHEQQFDLLKQNITQHRQQLRQYQYQEQQLRAFATQQAQQPGQQVQAVYPTSTKEHMQSMMPQTQQLQASATQQAQQPVQQMQAAYSTFTKERMHSVMPQTQRFQEVYPSPPKERMQCLMQQTQQLQASATQQAQQPGQQMQAVYPIPTKERMQSVMPQTQQFPEVYPTPPKERMQSVMQRNQQLQASSAQRGQQPTQKMRTVYSTPPKERKQTVFSLSSASPNKRTFQFMENIVPTDFVANPNNHSWWGPNANGNRTDLNGPQAKKARVSSK